MSAASQPFVQAVEVWEPSGSELVCRSSAYGPHAEFARASEGVSFRAGEGLPGAAWATGRSVLWSQLDGRFVRASAAQAAGLDAGIALPIYRGVELSAVVVLLCGSRERTGGSIEIWEENDLREIAMSAGYHGNLTAFGEISQLVRFQPGRGLPGIAWERGMPEVIADLPGSSAFVRAAAAREAGIQAGVGIPLFKERSVEQVVLLLSAQGTPLARAFESWGVTREGELELRESYYASQLHAAPGRALAERTLELGKPEAVTLRRDEESSDKEPRPLQFGLGIPIYDGTRVRAVVTLLN